MINPRIELAALEIETFEIAEIADLDSAFASAEMPVDSSFSCSVPTWCSTSSSCSIVTSCGPGS
ncbi:hypothetical protein GCM10009555_046300 [Acrocarpospora macrocephala]|uniref:Thiazolylpeptide-type bacteriocin n=1 Tax=Acrocarpospora macrocephala TaxID=150177 RepID=A0A5M3WZU4_9ACTN|nr:hypothetical protein [Acrocarpospora macrocephala]GES11973.1 hypothetical protein Amac_055700 [Acrocarpospora macrocephala]